MNTRLIRSFVAGGIAVVLSLAIPSDVDAQRSGVEVWSANCGRCHILQPTNKYTAKDWRSIGTHMAITARLTTAERDAVIAFLVSGAMREREARATVPERPVEADAPAAIAALPYGTALSPAQLDLLREYAKRLVDEAGQ